MPPGRTSALYSSTIADFLASAPALILGELVGANNYDLVADQKRAWEDEIEILREALIGVRGQLLFEFDVPRLGSRIDVVVLSGPAILPLEFKCGADGYLRADVDQVWDYALDLKNFHRASHDAPIYPVLIATEAPDIGDAWKPPHADKVREPLRCNRSGLRLAILSALAEASGGTLDTESWASAPYHPTPTIVEAARALYARHSVEAISRNDAGARNLRETSVCVDEIIESTRSRREKSVVFVTGVPGAGKTLVGLNVATRRSDFGEARAVFLSGNGPLVAVLREALTRDEYARSHGKQTKGSIGQKVKLFIQNIHHFRDDGVRDPVGAPYDHVVIFDEAQRTWDRHQTSKFMKIRKDVDDFDQSEAEFLLSYLDRHEAWAVVICLVGGGQEINVGEAGISAWLDAVRTKLPHWRVYVSPDLTDAEYGAGHALDSFSSNAKVVISSDTRLHLSSSMRSFRSEKVSAFIKALLDCETEKARDLLSEVSRRYPIAVTRELPRAKQWIRQHARGSERFGLVASSGAQRLKPHAIDVRIEVDPVHWFLNDRQDPRSSYFLEDAATQFKVQGLELDWVCVAWDADLRFRRPASWQYHAFRGDVWNNIRQSERKQYLLNAYRVLLTRARQGMVIFVPHGDRDDPTRSPEYYDETYDYLQSLGLASV